MLRPLRGPAGSNQVERLASDDLPLGIGKSWDEITGVLEPGDIVLLLSDGVLELWGGTLKGFQDAITRNAKSHNANPQAFATAFCSGANDSLDRDDLTAVILRRENLDDAALTWGARSAVKL